MADSGTCTLQATVVTGFEFVVKEEIKEKFGVDCLIETGKVFFDLPIARVKEVFNLKGADNIYVIIRKAEILQFTKDKEADLKHLCALPQCLDWQTGLAVWKEIANYKKASVGELLMCASDSTQLNTNETKEDSHEVISKMADLLSFRATCYRSGQNHSFTSMEAAATFGGAINDTFHWKVDLTSFDVEVVLYINNEKVYSCISLTKESLHHRNLSFFGPTSLRATIAHNMLRLCSIKPGDIVCDPMCGGGSIPIECSLCWPLSLVLCGDNFPAASVRSQQNMDALNEQHLAENKGALKLNVFQWDACQLPLKSNTVDVIITDLPFGKRLGRKADNRSLYPAFLEEATRVSKLKVGRAVLLTQDKKTLSRTIGRLHRFWHQSRVIGVNIGGLAACVYVLHRTAASVPELTSKEISQGQTEYLV